DGALLRCPDPGRSSHGLGARPDAASFDGSRRVGAIVRDAAVRRSAMTRLAEIESHIGNMVELREIVSAMRSLASMRVQEAQHVLPGIRSYAETMATGIGTALSLMPELRSTFGEAQG